MARVWRHPKSPFWFARFKASPGTLVNRSTKETNRKKAEEVARSYEEAGQRLGRGEHHVRVIRDPAKRYFQDTAEATTFKTYIETWLKRKSTEEVSAATLYRYRQIAEAMGPFLGHKFAHTSSFRMTGRKHAHAAVLLPPPSRRSPAVLRACWRKTSASGSSRIIS